MRHQRDRKSHSGEAQGLHHSPLSARWNLSRASVPEQAQSVAQSLPQVWGAAQLPEVGSEVSASTAVSGHKSHKERLPATEDQLRVVPVEVHLDSAITKQHEEGLISLDPLQQQGWGRYLYLLHTGQISTLHEVPLHVGDKIAQDAQLRLQSAGHRAHREREVLRAGGVVVHSPARGKVERRRRREEEEPGTTVLPRALSAETHQGATLLGTTASFNTKNAKTALTSYWLTGPCVCHH